MIPFPERIEGEPRAERLTKLHEWMAAYHHGIVTDGLHVVDNSRRVIQIIKENHNFAARFHEAAVETAITMGILHKTFRTVERRLASGGTEAEILRGVEQMKVMLEQMNAQSN